MHGGYHSTRLEPAHRLDQLPEACGDKSPELCTTNLGPNPPKDASNVGLTQHSARLQVTGTFKHQKVELRKQGAPPALPRP